MGSSVGNVNTAVVKKAKPKYLWFLSYLLSNISGGLTSPLIPLFVVIYLHSNVEFVGIASSISSSASVPALIFWGNLSDSLGKRKIFIVIGFIGSFFALLLVIFAHMLWTYIGMLVIFQIVAMAATPVSTLLILENSEEKEWPTVMARFNTVSYIGLVIGLLAGTVIITVFASFTMIILPLFYVISAFVYLSAGITALIILPESIRKLRRSRLNNIYSFRMVERLRYFPSNVIHIFKFKNMKRGKPLLPRTRNYIFLTCILMLGFQLFFVPFPVYLIDKLKASEMEIFIMYLLNNIFSTIAFKFAGASVRVMGLRATISFSLLSRITIISIASVLTFLVLPIGPLLYISIFLYGFMGFFWSFISIAWVTSISKLALPENRGKAIGLYNSFLGIGQIAGSAISGFVALEIGYGFDFITAAIVIVVGGFLISVFQLHTPELGKGYETGKSLSKVP
ncbi:MFS transporter [Oxyplasma meridianum]|uniref:MFS transporter n=1 Tax=Oxyplasma meridianum TaxID=3073602 RepID=A0AAX4NDI0_9ARCH